MVKHVICSKAWIYDKTRFYDKAEIWDKGILAIAISHRKNGSETERGAYICYDSDCDIVSEGCHRGNEYRGGPKLAIATRDIASEGGVKWCDIGSEEAKMHRMRVLTKFQINLVIPIKQTYGYISTKAGILIYMGFLLYF